MSEQEDRKERIESLVRQVERHQHLYYNDEPEISDQEFDRLWDELRALAPDHPLFSRLGADGSEAFPKRAHRMPMNSQDKASSPEQFLRWVRRVDHPRYIVQYKLDGASIELQYDQGEFLCGVTRGDGQIGDDISPNVRRMQGVPIRLKTPFTGAVRGEVIMEHHVHRTLYRDKANCRNAANGIMRRKDGIGSEHLKILCYDAFTLSGDVEFRQEEDKLEWIGANGFVPVPYQVFPTAQEVIHFRDLVIEERADLGYDIDGLVVKGPEIDPADMQRTRPQKQIAFKFSSEEGITVLRDVVWSESGHLYTPVAMVDPVQLAGTTVRRASLVHPELIETMGLRIGSEVVITKRGDIIPKIERLVRQREEREGDEGKIVPPSRCGTCGAEVVNEGKRVYCSNPSCPRRDFHRLRKWISVLDVRDFGDVLLGKLFEAGLVREIADLYLLEEDTLAALEGMGRVSARKALENLRSAGPIPLERFIAGFDIGGIAELKLRKVVEAGFDTLDRIAEASVEELSRAEGIAETTAEALLRGIHAVLPQMRRVLASGCLEVHQGPHASREAKRLEGLSFCFTGAMERMKRSDAEKLVRAAGGEVRSSVTGELGRLVTNDPGSNSSKARRARELGVPIISEDEFLSLLEEKDAGSVAPGREP
ncbi:MAG: DNA ligase (NAD(+)) LigA [Spirochaetaceae bacterium]|nr:MAG: DNA ligase (NAD(+)) LigA [Spirochaetaceae bacterium]